MTDHNSQDLFYSAVNLLNALSNQKRRLMLRMCSECSQDAAQISKTLDLGLMSVKKHLSILQKLNLVEKNGQLLHITQTGYGCLENIDSIEFLNNHKNFFLTHSFGDITQPLQRRLGNLKNCQFYQGFHIALPKWSKLITESKKYINLVFLHPPIIIADSIKPLIDTEVRIRLIVGKNSRITECNEFVGNLGLDKFKNHINFKKRRSKQVQVNLIMSENEAFLSFPNNDGVTDMHGNFASKDPSFLHWCSEFFESKWNNGEPIARLK